VAFSRNLSLMGQRGGEYKRQEKDVISSCAGRALICHLEKFF